MTKITVVNGYAEGFGFQGYWYTFTDNGDGGTSTITPECDDPCFSASGGSICVSGVAAQVPDEDSYSTYWGVGLGWNLNQAEETPNDPVPADLSGYSTLIIGLQVYTAATIRVKLDLEDESNYCVASIVQGSNVLDLRADFVDECWPGGAQSAIDPSLLGSVVALQIQVPTTLEAATPYDFCVTEVSFE